MQTPPIKSFCLLCTLHINHQLWAVVIQSNVNLTSISGSEYLKGVLKKLGIFLTSNASAGGDSNKLHDTRRKREKGEKGESYKLPEICGDLGICLTLSSVVEHGNYPAAHDEWHELAVTL